jgi:hypothetical protein
MLQPGPAACSISSKCEPAIELIRLYTLSCSEAADIPARAGVYLKRYAFDSLVEPLYLCALAIREQCLGADHCNTVCSSQNVCTGCLQAWLSLSASGAGKICLL